ncbi:hypothetical protein [Nocardioides limicola]|uniref:hypothetical protein n=1 Tax=Nocardioides limicola TaxID=2803368 RepID=UPI00193BB3DA|nr:hypothetical protein [Nocardioides sp. DJM-14]
MSADYCDLCELPRSTCIHGLPPKPPEPVRPAAPRATARAKSAVKSKPAGPAVATRRATRRWSAPETFRPLILQVLGEAGGTLAAEDLFAGVELLAEELLLPGDRQKTPEGELRWRYAARQARQALIREGVMIKGAPGVWELADRG